MVLLAAGAAGLSQQVRAPFEREVKALLVPALARNVGTDAGARFVARGLGLATARGTMHKGVPLCEVLARACAAIGTRRRISGDGLRHTAVDTLRRSTSSLISRCIVGHASDRMHERYSHPDEQELIDAATLLGGQVGGSGA